MLLTTSNVRANLVITKGRRDEWMINLNSGESNQAMEKLDFGSKVLKILVSLSLSFGTLIRSCAIES